MVNLFSVMITDAYSLIVNVDPFAWIRRFSFARVINPLLIQKQSIKQIKPIILYFLKEKLKDNLIVNLIALLVYFSEERFGLLFAFSMLLMLKNDGIVKINSCFVI